MKTRLVEVALLGVLSVGGCGKGETGSVVASKPATPVQVTKATMRDLARTVTYTGSVEPVRVARMASPAEGPVVECAVREGDRVRRDQVLVRIGRSLVAQASLEAAREDVARQESEFRRVERLVASGSLPGEQLEIARAALKRAQAQLAAAQTGAGDYEIRAPWDGLVAKVWVAEGNYVTPRAPLVEIYDPASLLVRFPVPESDSRFMAVNAPVRVTLDAWPGRVFDGRVARVYPQLDPGSRTLTVEADIRADVKLLAGMFARVQVQLEKAAGAVVVPSGALVALPNGTLALFVAAADTASRRIVEVGLETADEVQILSGVAPGEDVIVRGQESLKPGSPIRIMGQKKGQDTPKASDAPEGHGVPKGGGESKTNEAKGRT